MTFEQRPLFQPAKTLTFSLAYLTTCRGRIRKEINEFVFRTISRHCALFGFALEDDVLWAASHPYDFYSEGNTKYCLLYSLRKLLQSPEHITG